MGFASSRSDSNSAQSLPPNVRMEVTAREPRRAVLMHQATATDAAPTQAPCAAKERCDAAPRALCAAMALAIGLRRLVPL